MKQSTKLFVFIGFLTLFFGGAAFMYFRYIHNKPRILIVAPKTEIDPIKFDSLLLDQQRKIKGVDTLIVK